ncbi:helix-turn-helix domain-containing protein [Spirosoma sp. HMF4905]|uniref:Helix-turn-helix domain-containing protein n=1 Tax=Spirosoma arboris TaxID=2682092 RepID=A0A7K1SBH9_9BACT|nr:AraC family transcriptional regulator [Spirosoma arboris]MVM31167.1 helix-turn-helix domain-containing protein [Spirosoma arboris]
MKASVNKTCLIGPALREEQFIAEHLFFYLKKGTISGYASGKHYTLHAGEYGITRKNRLSRQDPSKVTEEVEKIIFVFDESFLRTFQAKHQLITTPFNSEESFIRLSGNVLFLHFIDSLTPYYNDQGQMDAAFFDVKREELLLILLQLEPELAGLFFDYGVPQKIDLEAFMNRNYRFNVTIDRFAYLTGRSLSAFKRDFHNLFNETPSRWLLRKRLEDAYNLLEKRSQKPSDIYLNLGFETLSHFSVSFKKRFGHNPTDLTGPKRKVAAN